MKLYTLYFENDTQQEIFAFRLSQAVACCAGRLVGYDCAGEWE